MRCVIIFRKHFALRALRLVGNRSIIFPMRVPGGDTHKISVVRVISGLDTHENSTKIFLKTIIVTSTGLLRSLKCIKIRGGWGFASDPTRGDYSASETPSCISGGRFAARKKRERNEERGKEEGKGGEGLGSD